MKSYRLLFFDTETTGLPLVDSAPLAQQPRIIEIAAMRMDVYKGGWKRADTLEMLINPGQLLTTTIKNITGISDGDLEGKSTWYEMHRHIQAFFSKADEIIAHNLTFDKALVDMEMQRIDREFEWANKMTCSVEATEYLEGRRLSLDDFYKRMFPEMNRVGQHRAMNDVRDLANAWIEALKQELV